MPTAASRKECATTWPPSARSPRPTTPTVPKNKNNVFVLNPRLISSFFVLFVSVYVQFVVAFSRNKYASSRAGRRRLDVRPAEILQTFDFAVYSGDVRSEGGVRLPHSGQRWITIKRGLTWWPMPASKHISGSWVTASSALFLSPAHRSKPDCGDLEASWITLSSFTIIN